MRLLFLLTKMLTFSFFESIILWFNACFAVIESASLEKILTFCAIEACGLNGDVAAVAYPLYALCANTVLSHASEIAFLICAFAVIPDNELIPI